MPLGRFAAYFFLLMAVCLISFPRAVGAPPLPDAALQTDRLPPFCTDDPDGGLDCAPSDPSLAVSRCRTAPPLRRRLEAGETAPLPPAFPAGSGRHLLDS